MFNKKLSEKESRLNSLIIICDHLRSEAEYRPEVKRVLQHYEQQRDELANSMEVTYIRTLKTTKQKTTQKSKQLESI